MSRNRDSSLTSRDTNRSHNNRPPSKLKDITKRKTTPLDHLEIIKTVYELKVEEITKATDSKFKGLLNDLTLISDKINKDIFNQLNIKDVEYKKCLDEHLAKNEETIANLSIQNINHFKNDLKNNEDHTLIQSDDPRINSLKQKSMLLKQNIQLSAMELNNKLLTIKYKISQSMREKCNELKTDVISKLNITESSVNMPQYPLNEDLLAIKLNLKNRNETLVTEAKNPVLTLKSRNKEETKSNFSKNQKETTRYKEILLGNNLQTVLTAHEGNYELDRKRIEVTEGIEFSSNSMFDDNISDNEYDRTKTGAKSIRIVNRMQASQIEGKFSQKDIKASQHNNTMSFSVDFEVDPSEEWHLSPKIDGIQNHTKPHVI